MPELATGDHPERKMVNPGAAAVAIGSTMHMAAVPPATCEMPVRAFGTFTRDLHALADWFADCGVTSVAPASTGVSWIPACAILGARGFKVILVNARYARNVPSRKTVTTLRCGELLPAPEARACPAPDRPDPRRRQAGRV